MELLNTNLNYYKPFLVVYENGNMRKAAEILNMSVPAISNNIKSLARDLNFDLFVSLHNRGVEPTEYAKRIYPAIKQAFDLIANSTKKPSESNAEETELKEIDFNLQITYPESSEITEDNKRFIDSLTRRIIVALIEASKSQL